MESQFIDPAVSNAAVESSVLQMASQVTVSGQPQDTSLTRPEDSTFLNHSVTYTTERALNESLKKKSSLDFAEQIRKLEVEGNKLRAATVSSLSNSLLGSNFESTGNVFESKPTSALGQLNTLVDISADQKAISDLRTQLEVQRKETERLQKQLLGDLPSFHSISGLNGGQSAPAQPLLVPGPSLSTSGCISNTMGGSAGVYPPAALSPSKAAFSTISGAELMSSASPRRTYDYQPPSHLERSLKECQEQVVDLRKRLQETTEASDQQKRQFRMTVEELKSKLHDTIQNRDTVLDLRQKESKNQETLINKLQSSLNQLQEQFKAQEEILTSTNRRLESHSHSSHVTDTALASMRSLLYEREKKRGRPFFDTDPVPDQNPAMLVHSLERCLQDVEHELTVKTYRVNELENDVEEKKKITEERERSIGREYQEIMKREASDSVKKMSDVISEHEKRFYELKESSDKDRLKLSDLQREGDGKEQSHMSEMQSKDMVIRDLQEKVEDLSTEEMQKRALWQEKRQALESSLDEVQKELIETRGEKNDLVRQVAVIESRMDDLQSLTSRQEQDLHTERDRVREQRTREEDLRAKVMNLELTATHKQADVDRLERLLEAVKQECSVQVLDKVATVEKLERDRYVDQIQSLSAQLATVTEKCHRASVDQQMSRQEMEAMRSQVSELTDKLEKARSQMESALSDKNELTSKIGDSRFDLERLTRDKDQWAQQAESQASQMAGLKAQVERLREQVEEKEKVLGTFRQQSSSITQLMEVNSKASDAVREERERLSTALAEKTCAVDELKTTHDTLKSKVKARDRRLRELEDEVIGVTEQLAIRSQEMEALQCDRDSACAGLRDSRKETQNMAASKDALKKELARVKSLRTKEVTKLQTKLKDTEQENRLSQKVMRSTNAVDHKAVKFADKIQKEMTLKRGEMDQLLSRIHRLEEKLENVNKEKTMVEKDKDSLKKSLAKSLLHTQGLTEELGITQAQNMELVRRVAALDDEMERASLKASATSSQMEKQEQEITTLRLRHQLDLKEAERPGRGVREFIGSEFAGSSLPSSASAYQRLGSVSEAGSKNTLEIRDERHKDYSDVGKELKGLLGEMRGLISGHREDRLTHELEVHSARGEREKVRSKWSSSPLSGMDLGRGGQDIHSYKQTDRPSNKQTDADADNTWGSKSMDLGDMSDFSLYKEWRPRSRSQRSSPDFDASNASFMSKGGYLETSRLSQSAGSHKKAPSPTVPDTQELCRRLEEKIDSLTRMGGNLQKENKEMADLISLQGEKLVTVKQMERKTREKC